MSSNTLLGAVRRFEPPSWWLEPRTTVAVALGAAVVVGLVTYAVGEVVAAVVDVQVTVPNPEYPGDTWCNLYDTPSCSEPATFERPLEAVLPPLFADLAMLLAAFLILNWLLFGVVVHVLVLLRGGYGTFAETFAVAAWSNVPMVVASLVNVTAFAVAVALGAGTASVPAFALELFDRVTVQGIYGVVAFLGVLCSAVVWQFGLQRAHHWDADPASVVAGGYVLLFVWSAVF